jgi:hypothetical protein
MSAFIVGVNGYNATNEEMRIPILAMDPQGYERQVGRLHKLRQSRDNERVGQTLEALRQAAAGTENTMPYLLDAVKAYATLGEITDVLRDVTRSSAPMKSRPGYNLLSLGFVPNAFLPTSQRPNSCPTSLSLASSNRPSCPAAGA